MTAGATQILAEGVDLALESGKGIVHADATLAGQVLRYNGTRFIPAKLAITDMSAAHSHSITGAADHTHPITRSTKKYDTGLMVPFGADHYHEVDVYGSDLVAANTGAGGAHSHGGATGTT